MTESDYMRQLDERKANLVAVLGPAVRAKLEAGKTPQEAAQELAAEGYYGLSSTRCGVLDVHRVMQTF